MYSMILDYFNTSGMVADFALMKPWSIVTGKNRKSELWLGLERVLKRKFDTPEEMQVAFQNHPDYEHYVNDKKKPESVLKDLEKIGPPGANCVDISQIVRSYFN